ncbi:MAG TPA: hypothetical protein PLZ51_21485, partial [Aggregatilineales bacterium]|nr:hypothetical protein [Aggregatilineales bacterium]
VIPYENDSQSPDSIRGEECVDVVGLPQPLCYWTWIIPSIPPLPIGDGVIIDAVGDGGVEEIGDSSTYPRCDVLREELISQHSTEWRLEGEYLVQYLIVNPDVPLPEPKPCVDDIFTTTYDPTGILIGLYQAQYESFPSDEWLANTAVNLEGILIGLSVNPQGILIGLSVDPTAILIGLSVNPEGILIGLSVDPTGILIGLSQPSAEEIPAQENASITRFDYLAGTALNNRGDLFVGFNGNVLGADFLNLADINGD